MWLWVTSCFFMDLQTAGDVGLRRTQAFLKRRRVTTLAKTSPVPAKRRSAGQRNVGRRKASVNAGGLFYLRTPRGPDTDTEANRRATSATAIALSPSGDPRPPPPNPARQPMRFNRMFLHRRHKGRRDSARRMRPGSPRGGGARDTHVGVMPTSGFYAWPIVKVYNRGGQQWPI